MLPLVRVQALAASSRPPRVLALEHAASLLPALVLALERAASLWPPRVLALVLVLAASPSKRPQAPVQALAVALTPRALALQRVASLTPREPPRVLAFASTRALGLQLGPSYVCTAASRHRCSGLLYGFETDCWRHRAVLLRPRSGQNSQRARIARIACASAQ